jgi:hypothetical protein
VSFASRRGRTASLLIDRADTYGVDDPSALSEAFLTRMLSILLMLAFYLPRIYHSARFVDRITLSLYTVDVRRRRSLVRHLNRTSLSAATPACSNFSHGTESTIMVEQTGLAGAGSKHCDLDARTEARTCYLTLGTGRLFGDNEVGWERILWKGSD